MEFFWGVLCGAFLDAITFAFSSRFWVKRCKRKCELFICPKYFSCGMSAIVQKMKDIEENNNR